MLKTWSPLIHKPLSHGQPRPYRESHVFQKLPGLMYWEMVMQVDCVGVLSINTVPYGPVTPFRQSCVRLTEGMTKTPHSPCQPACPLSLTSSTGHPPLPPSLLSHRRLLPSFLSNATQSYRSLSTSNASSWGSENKLPGSSCSIQYYQNLTAFMW